MITDSISWHNGYRAAMEEHNVTDLKEEFESLRKDAERYRKLKTMNKKYVIGIINNTSNLISHGGLSLDEAIDAAMGEKK